MRVPFNRMLPVGNELAYVSEVAAGDQLGGTGPRARRCEEILAQLIGSERVLLTASATASLEIAAMLLNIGHGDDVIMPSFTFVSTANAVVLRGGRPVFAEIRPEDLNVDVAAVRAAVTPATRAVFPIHYAGRSPDMSGLMELCRSKDLVCVEDAAQSLGASESGRPLGSEGALAAFSFHESKNVGCGEGGALAINDTSYLERALILRDKGTNRQAFLSGAVDKYTWTDIGSSFVLSELAAAYLLAQLEKLEEVTERRRAVWKRYEARLAPTKRAGVLDWPKDSSNTKQNGHIFYVLANTMKERDDLIAQLASKGVQAFFHYVPLHLSPVGHSLGYREGDLPWTEDLAARLVRLPLFHQLTDEMVDYVADEVLSFFGLLGTQ